MEFCIFCNPQRDVKQNIVFANDTCYFLKHDNEQLEYQTKDVLDAMEEDSGITLKSLRVDGDAVKNDFLMQFQSDILDVEEDRPVINETTALGAAYLAGLAVGYWKNRSEISERWKNDKSFQPKMEIGKRNNLYG